MMTTVARRGFKQGICFFCGGGEAGDAEIGLGVPAAAKSDAVGKDGALAVHRASVDQAWVGGWLLSRVLGWSSSGRD